MLLTVERVLTLKTVDLFSQTAEETLAEMAAMVEEVHVQAGTRIIEKGDIGTSMYIVVKGRVRVHEGETTLSELGERSVFGELAALDPEPRLASVTALEETHLFRLGKDALNELMAEHVGLAQGIIQVLCRRIRAFRHADGGQRRGYES